jgi:hypothetical protein
MSQKVKKKKHTAQYGLANDYLHVQRKPLCSDSWSNTPDAKPDTSVMPALSSIIIAKGPQNEAGLGTQVGPGERLEWAQQGLYRATEPDFCLLLSSDHWWQDPTARAGRINSNSNFTRSQVD